MDWILFIQIVGIGFSIYSFIAYTFKKSKLKSIYDAKISILENNRDHYAKMYWRKSNEINEILSNEKNPLNILNKTAYYIDDDGNEISFIVKYIISINNTSILLDKTPILSYKQIKTLLKHSKKKKVTTIEYNPSTGYFSDFHKCPNYQIKDVLDQSKVFYKDVNDVFFSKDELFQHKLKLKEQKVYQSIDELNDVEKDITNYLD